MFAEHEFMELVKIRKALERIAVRLKEISLARVPELGEGQVYLVTHRVESEEENGEKDAILDTFGAV